MRIRRLIVAAGAAALLATGLQTARAEDVVDYDVGGGVAAVVVQVQAQDNNFRSLPAFKGNDVVTVAKPYDVVILGKNGGTKKLSIVDKKVSNLVSVKAGFVTITGKRNGQPFANGESLLTGLNIKGTDIRALNTKCNWTNGQDPTGSVVVTNANGQTYEPAPNTAVPIPGVGTLFLNEQFVDGEYIYNDAGGQSYQQVIYVYGARLHVESDLTSALVNHAESDIILGFTSCDPIKLPNLSGLKLSSTST
jgi:hypothetical protein